MNHKSHHGFLLPITLHSVVPTAARKRQKRDKVERMDKPCEEEERERRGSGEHRRSSGSHRDSGGRRGSGSRYRDSEEEDSPPPNISEGGVHFQLPASVRAVLCGSPFVGDAIFTRPIWILEVNV